VSRYYRPTYTSIGFPRWTHVVRILIIACSITFLVQLFTEPLLTVWFGLTPWDVTHRGYVWQLVSYIFLHDPRNLLHILLNMLGLWMFGSELEQVWGSRQFTRFFFVCGVGAGLVMVLLFLLTGGDSHVTTIGASGALYGILLAYGILFPDRIIYFLIFPIPAKYFVMMLGAIAFFSSIFGPGGGIAHVAHLGGMLCGYLYLKTAGMGRSRGRGFSFSIRDWYSEWRRRRLRRKFEVYYNRRHQNEKGDNDKWGSWKN
jgi:membrane associated rhomboid family serine protease